MELMNFPAVLAAGAAHFAIGMIWYSPLLFGKIWMELSGLSETKLTPRDLGAAFCSSLIVAYVLACVVLLAGARTLLDGAVVGIMAEVGFVATLLLGDMIFEKKPLKLFLVRNGYNLLALAAAGAILAVWR